jgi:NAD-dependent SIR2 family protein deacetylase
MNIEEYNRRCEGLGLAHPMPTPMNALEDMVRQRDNLRKIADDLIQSFGCERALRLDGNFETNSCENCISALAAYWEEFDAR